MPMSAFGLGRGRPVAAGSTPSKLISAKSSASTNTSITRTGLLSSMKSSRHSGNSVHCPRSASSTKRLINSPTESRENHNSSTAFSHSQGQTRTLRLSGRMSVLPPRTDIERPLRHVRSCQLRTSSKLPQGLQDASLRLALWLKPTSGAGRCEPSLLKQGRVQCR